MSGGATKKREYNRTLDTLIAIWDVLATHASREHPLSVAQIVEILQRNGDMRTAPSANTLRRYLPMEKEALDRLIPSHTLHESNRPDASLAYFQGGTLHVVLENRDALTAWEGDMAALFELRPHIDARYSTVANLLKSYPQNETAFSGAGLPPVRLKCLMAQNGASGKTTYVPYQKWEEEYDRQGKEPPTNQPRYYYLESVLSKAEWRMLADMVKVYPYITQSQTAKFLAALSRLDPERGAGQYALDERYAFKYDRNERFFRIIGALDAAIAQHKRVVVEYGQYVLERSDDGKWLPVLKKRENAKNEYGLWVLEPYALMWSNGYYYLVGKNKAYGMMNLRVDRVLSVTPQKDAFEPEQGFHPAEYRDRSPVMYPGEAQLVRLRCKVDMINTVLDFFGAKANFREPKDGYTEVSMNVAPKGVRLFVMQYADRVEALEPKSLRDEVRSALQAALEAYQ